MSDISVKLNWNGGLKFTGVNAGGLETALDGDSNRAPVPSNCWSKPWARAWRLMSC